MSGAVWGRPRCLSMSTLGAASCQACCLYLRGPLMIGFHRRSEFFFIGCSAALVGRTYLHLLRLEHAGPLVDAEATAQCGGAW